MSASTTAHPAPMPASEDLLEVLFNVSITGTILFQPVFAAGGAEIVDLAYVRLNAAAQQMLRLPERPEQSLLALYPTARPTRLLLPGVSIDGAKAAPIQLPARRARCLLLPRGAV